MDSYLPNLHFKFNQMVSNSVKAIETLKASELTIVARLFKEHLVF